MNEPTGITNTRDQRNVNRYIRLSALWAVVYAACTWVLARDYNEPVLLSWVIAFVPSLFAAFSARAYWRYLHGLDELLRAIELRALALAISAGFVIWPAIELIEIGIPLEIHVPVILLVMTAVYVFGLAKGRKEYL